MSSLSSYKPPKSINVATQNRTRLTKPALLHPSKRYSRTANQPRVRPHHAHLERLRDPPYPSDIPTEEIPRQPYIGRIGHRDHLLLCLEFDQGCDRTKRFFVRE